MAGNALASLLQHAVRAHTHAAHVVQLEHVVSARQAVVRVWPVTRFTGGVALLTGSHTCVSVVAIIAVALALKRSIELEVADCASRTSVVRQILAGVAPHVAARTGHRIQVLGFSRITVGNARSSL